MKNLTRYIMLAMLVSLAFELPAQTSQIKFAVKGLYPEGTVFNPKNTLFYVSCVIDGHIGTVDMEGNYKTFYQDKSLKSTYGMTIDAKQNRLWVCVSDANYSNYSDSTTFKKLARVIALDLTTGKKVADINLAGLYKGKHFINDLVMDNAGNIYATDSFSPVIYKIDVTGKASILAQSDEFKGEDIALNGIVYHAGGFLLVDVGNSGAIYKVDLKNPKNISRVKMMQLFPGADGLILNDAATLTLIQNKGVDKVFQLTSSDNWQTASVKAATSTEDRFQQPSTGTIADGKTYVLNSKLNELADPTKRPSIEFSLQQAEFKTVP